MSSPDFWNDRESAETLVTKLKTLKNRLIPYNSLKSDLVSLRELMQLNEDEGDDSLVDAIIPELEKIK